jgi:hypothetical protein
MKEWVVMPAAQADEWPALAQAAVDGLDQDAASEDAA